MEQGGALNPLLFTLRRIAYSIKEDRNDMATWNSRGLRGSTLEDMNKQEQMKIQGERPGAHTKDSHSDYTYKDGAGNQTHYTGLFRAEEYG